MKVLGYLKRRVAEQSTWVSIGIAITGAAALSPPWSYLFVAVGVIGALVPTTKKECADDE